MRIVAATNKNLRDEIVGGNFREDLFHRLAVIPVHVPSLNDRRGDIPLLVEHFLKIICDQHGKVQMDVTSQAMESLKSANWTGNIRELRNVVERLVILTPKGEAIDDAVVSRFGGLTVEKD